MARKRGLSPEDKALWSRVASTVAPMHPRLQDPAPEPLTTPKAPAPVKTRINVAAELAARLAAPSPGRPGPKPLFPSTGIPSRTSHDLAPSHAERLAAQPIRMDARTHRNMVRGKLRPEARIDLHGMTLAVAHPALISFVLGAQGRGYRMILVITGKGKPGSPDAPLPVRPGALRHNVPHWLQMAPLSAIVLQVTAAHRSHGGEGAYYVYLRK